MLGNKEESGTFYYLKLRGTKKGELPFFSVTQKDENGKYPEIKQVNSVSGHLVGIKKESYEWEGEKVNTFKLEMRDGDEVYIVTFGYNMISRNMLNCLAACENISTVELKVYVDKKTGHQRMFTTVNGGKTGWKYESDVLTPMIEKVTNKKGEVVSTDTSELDAFFAKVIDNEILPKLSHSLPATPKADPFEQNAAAVEAQAPKSVGKTKKVVEPIEDDGDLPF